MNVVSGHYRMEGGSLEIGTLLIEKSGSGFIAAESGARLVAERYAVADDVEGAQITSPDALFEFLPDAGELERVGMTITA